MFELIFAPQCIEGGAKESHKKQHQQDATTMWSRLLDGDGGTLKRDESGRYVLQFSIGRLQIGCQRVVGVELQLHVIFQIFAFTAHTFKNQILVAITERAI